MSFELAIKNVRELPISYNEKSKIIDMINSNYTTYLIKKSPADIKRMIFSYTYIPSFTRYFGIELKDYMLYSDIYYNIDSYIESKNYIMLQFQQFRKEKNKDSSSKEKLKDIFIHIAIVFFLYIKKNKTNDFHCISSGLHNNKQYLPKKFYERMSKLTS